MERIARPLAKIFCISLVLLVASCSGRPSDEQIKGFVTETLQKGFVSKSWFWKYTPIDALTINRVQSLSDDGNSYSIVVTVKGICVRRFILALGSTPAQWSTPERCDTNRQFFVEKNNGRWEARGEMDSGLNRSTSSRSVRCAHETFYFFTVNTDQRLKILTEPPFYLALKKAGVEVKFVPVPGGKHGRNFGLPAGDPRLSEYMDEVARWFDRHLRRQPTK